MLLDNAVMDQEGGRNRDSRRERGEQRRRRRGANLGLGGLDAAAGQGEEALEQRLHDEFRCAASVHRRDRRGKVGREMTKKKGEWRRPSTERTLNPLCAAGVHRRDRKEEVGREKREKEEWIAMTVDGACARPFFFGTPALDTCEARELHHPAIANGW